MTFTVEAVAESLNVPPRVVLTATEDDPDLSIRECVFFRDGVPLRFEAAVTGDQAVAFDYDAAFDVPIVYRADATELGTLLDWTETWASLAAWTGSGWSVAGGVASSTIPDGAIVRDAAGTIIEVVVNAPTNMKVQLTDDFDVVLITVTVSPDGTITLEGTTTSKVTGSGTFTLSVTDDSVAIAGTGWSTSVPYEGAPSRVRLVAPSVATFLSKFTFAEALDGPNALAVAPSGDIWVVQYGSSEVHRYNSSGVYQGQLAASFTSPTAIAIDASGNLYVSDAGNHRVQKFDSAGTHLLTFGSSGTANGQFSSPAGIAIDSAGNPWVVDSGNNRVQKFNSSGVYQSKFGTGGSGDGQFNVPNGIAIGASDAMWVTDTSNDRVQKFNSSGVFQSKFGTPGVGNGQFNDPLAIALDAAGNIWVSDESQRIQKFDSAGAFVGKFGSFGAGDSQFGFVYGIDFDAAGNLLAADRLNRRVQKFDTTGGSVDDIATRISLDEPVDVTDTDDPVTLTPTGANAGAWMTNAATPDLAILIDKDDCGNHDYYIATETRAATELEANSVELPIEGSPDVVVVPLGPRRNETWTLHVACKTETARQGLIALLANSSAVLLRFMASQEFLGLADGFYSVGRVTTTRDEGPAVDPTAVVNMPLIPTRAPRYKPLWQWNWDALAQTGYTWDDVNTIFDSWNALLVGSN